MANETNFQCHKLITHFSIRQNKRDASQFIKYFVQTKRNSSKMVKNVQLANQSAGNYQFISLYAGILNLTDSRTQCCNINQVLILT